MDAQKVITKMKEWYPGKTIIALPENYPTEIICEIEPTSAHADYSVVISVIDRTAPHHHRMTKETYTVLEGELDLFVDGVKHHLTKGGSFTIQPSMKHYAIGDETWVECWSEPGWKVDDHILA